MTTKKIDINTYMELLTNADNQFTFANGLSICKGSKDWSPKYTVAYAMEHADNAETFIANVEQICEHMQFKIDVSDKANLAKYYQNNSNNAIVDESYDVVDESELCTIAKTFDVEVSKRNGCILFESKNPYNLNAFINAVDDSNKVLGIALRRSKIEQDFDMFSKTALCID